MEKRKYEKPSTTPLSAVQPAQGSCVSGNPEYQMVDCSAVGDVALTTCVPGSIVYPETICQPSGSDAGLSCLDGAGAG